MEVRGQHHALAALCPGNNPGTHYIGDSVGDQRRALEKRKSLRAFLLADPGARAPIAVRTSLPRRRCVDVNVDLSLAQGVYGGFINAEGRLECFGVSRLRDRVELECVYLRLLPVFTVVNIPLLRHIHSSFPRHFIHTDIIAE
jgi:hypothetical protein